jgi:hypothetical protein
MSYLIGALVILGFFAFLHFATELEFKKKIIITVTLLAVVIFATIYNKSKKTDQLHIEKIQLEYSQGKTLQCLSNTQEIDINKSAFSYSVGTQTFIGRKESKHFNLMINARACQ